MDYSKEAVRQQKEAHAAIPELSYLVGVGKSKRGWLVVCLGRYQCFFKIALLLNYNARILLQKSVLKYVMQTASIVRSIFPIQKGGARAGMLKGCPGTDHSQPRHKSL